MTNAPTPPIPTDPMQPADNDKNIALLVWIGGIFFGFIPSLIVWLMNKDKPGWLTDQCREALNFQITVMIAYLASWVLIFIIIGLFLFFIVLILSLVFGIIGAIKSSQGISYRCPLAIRLLK